MVTLTRGEDSPWVQFLRNIKGRGYPESSIRNKFAKLVPKEDYSKSDKEDLIKFALKYGSKSSPRS